MAVTVLLVLIFLGDAIRDRGAIKEQASSRIACDSESFMLTEGVWAEIKIGGEHLRLFAEHSAQGVQASVYNVSTKSWVAPSEAVDDIEEGKEKAEQYAKAYLKSAADLELPALIWKKSRSR